MNPAPYTIDEMKAICAALIACRADEEEFDCATDPMRAEEACGMFADREARVGWERIAFAGAYEIIAKRWPGHAFLARFPTIERDVSTGGGCTAWTLTLPSGEQLMMTSADGGYQPDETDETASVGYYDARGEWDEINRPDYTWSELTAFVDGFLSGKVL